MGKTYNQIKQAVLGKNYDINKNTNQNTEKKEKTYEEIKRDVLGGKYDFSKKKSELESIIGFNTFSSDLSSINDTVNSAYNTWQTQDDLVRTRNQMERMQERILAYKKYQKLFGKDKLPELDISYHSALEGWDALSNEYAKYDNAETYSKETTRLKELGGMTSADVQAVLDELPDLEEKAKNATQYEQKIKELTRNAINIRNPSAIKSFETALNKATEERDNYLKSIGYESTEALEKALTDKRIAYTTIGGENITWESLYKQKKQQEDSEALYKQISSMEDFSKYRDEGKNIQNPSPKDVEKGISIAGWKPFGEDVGNIVEYSIENQAGIMMSNGSATGDVVYSTMTRQERDIYNYHLGKERAGEAEKGTADEYLKSIYGVLKDRYENKVVSGLAEYADEHPVLASGVSVWQNLGAGGEWLKDSSNYLKTGELDDNHLAKASSTIRGVVSDKVDWEIGNWDAFDFVYNTGMSMIDSAVAMTAFGNLGGVALGMSAAAQGTNDALERGLDNKRAFFSGLSAGVFEGLFESLSIGRFKSLKEAPVDGVKDIIKNVGKSMLTNASEETLTEIANLTYDYLANGDLSQAKTQIRAYVNAGMSEKEAIRKVALEQASQVAEAGASGALMGLGFGGITGPSAYRASKETGKTIKANERVSDLFNIVSDPETASAYEAYTEYANKGINAENVSDAQLGKLAYSAVEEAYNIINSETATAEQKAQAKKTIADLEVFAQKPQSRVSKKEAKKYDDAMVQGIIDAGLDNDTNSESYRLAMEYDAKVKSGKKLTTAEISKLVEANERSYRNEDAKAVTDRLTELGETADVPEVARIIERKMNGEAITADEYQAVKDSKYGNQVLLENTDADIVSQAEAMETDDGELFMRLYDGKTDAEAYANSFNLVAEYAKAPSISTDYVLEHRGVLTPSQTSQIYNHFAVKASKEAKIKFDQEAQKQFNDAIAKMEENLKVSREGFVDTSVIDFTNSSTEGKVNWKDLKPRQQQAVTFVSGLFKAMGANVVFVDKTKKFNGMYHQEGDTVFVDVYAGMDIIKMMGKDSIIPTTAHELTHMMEVHSPGEFKELADMVLDYLAEVKHLTRQELIANEMARLDEKHSDNAPHSEKDAISEIVARACEDMLSVSKEGRRLFESLSEEQQKSFADKVKEIFKKLTEWLDKLLNSYESTSDEAKAIRGVKSVFDEVSARWDKMLADIAVGNQADVTTSGGAKFQMRENVEETRDLIAVHNMRVNELERTLDLGGLPMPSIAIIKAKSGHSEYGDVSLVFPKSVIDPKANKNNKVYGGDAWTPVYPKIEYKPSAKVSKKINDKYYELSRKYGYDESKPLYNYVYDLEEQLNRHKGESELINELYDDTRMMQLYLLDSGRSKVETVKKEVRTELSDAEVEMNEFFIRELGADVVDAVMFDGNGSPMTHRKNYLSKYEDAIREAYKKLLSEVYQFTDEQVQNVLDSIKSADYLRFMRDAYKYNQNGRVTTKTEDDYEATKQAIKDAAGEGYIAWVDSLFKGVEEKSGIRNNADYFTNSGNRRSWEALHWENNLENVVKVMKSQDNGVAALFSGHAILAVSAKDYRSIEEIKADSDRLKRLSEEEYSEIKQGFGSRFEEIAQSIMNKSESNPFIAMDNAMSVIIEAVRNSKTKSGLLKNLREYQQLTVTETTVEDIISLVSDISNMPTEYFEAKPKRAVGLNEIATAIIPDNTSNTTKTRLDDMGIKYLEYENGNEQSRLEALNSLESVRFSERETTNIYDIMGERDRLKKRNEILEADIKRLKEMQKLDKKVTMGAYLDRSKLSAIAKHIKKISNSTIAEDALVERLNEVYLSMRKAADYTWDEIYGRFYSVAEEVLAESKPRTQTDDFAKMILKDIRATRISLTESQKKEAQYIFGKNWNRHFFNRVTITDSGASIDSQWQEWAKQYPYLFKTDISDADMIKELYDVIITLQDASVITEEYDEQERISWLAMEIYNKHWTANPLHTTADKYDAQIKVLKFEHRKAMEELRTAFKESQKDALNEQRIKYKKLIADLRTQRDEGIARAKQHGRDMLDKYKDNAERKTRIQRITANVLTLNKWLTKNNKDYHIHEAMKGPVIKLLNAIDFSSGRLISGGNPTQRDISLAEAFADVRTMLANATNMVTGLEELYGHDLTESIELLAEGAFALIGDNSYTINTMSNEELYHLDKLVRHIKKAVTNLNNFHAIHHNQGALNLGEEFIEYGKKLKKLDKQHGTFGKFFVFRNRTPYYFFKELGSAGQKMFEAFQDGWDKLAFNAKKVIDFSEKTYTSKEVQKWSEEKKTFTLSQPDGSHRTIEMSTAQIMALHCVAKQDDAQYHLFGGGMTLKRIDKKGHVVTDYENISLTMSDVQMITSALNSRQIEVADKLQEFMNTVCSDWGNEISMARFGIKMFGIKDYFPIKVSSATVPTDTKKDIDNASLFRLLGMSFTKDRKHNAPQSIEIGDIFDIFAQHSADMAKYNALALPVLDFAKWYSMHGMDANGKEYGVVQTLQSVFGDEADGYLRRFVRDINGSQNVSRDVLGNKLFKNAKVASVAANLRVVLLQPTAYFKAGAVMDNKYLMKASSYVNVNPVSMIGKLKKAAEQAEKYCGIIQWKSLGYYDTDISKGLTAKIKHSDGKLDKLIEKSMKGAEIADKATFATLWIACEFEIRDTRKDLRPGSREFYDAIGKRLREIVYATQVVDSTMTRSDMMRSSDGRDKMLTTFGSEPILAYNMLLDLVTTYNRDKQALGKAVARKKNANKIRKVVTAYVITNAVAAIVESGFDYLRDDEDEIDVAEFMKMWLSNFVSDISIGNKLPIIKDIYSMAQGYSASRMDVQGIGYVFNAIKDVDKLINGKGNWAKFIKDVIRAGSTLSGLPAYNIYREAMALLDKLDIVGED